MGTTDRSGGAAGDALGQPLNVFGLPDGVGLLAAVRRVLVLVACGLTPLLLLGAFLSPAFQDQPAPAGDVPAFGFDFRPTWDAGGRILDGEPLYPPARAEVLAGEDQFVYPPAPAVAALALRPLGFELSSFLLALGLVGAVLLTLRLLGVRDWRCYGVAMLALPVLDGIRLGALSAFLTLAAALAWRYRSSVWVVGVALGAALAAKLFLWPLVLWLLVTRRVRHALAAAGIGVAMTFTAWLAAGFSGLREYPALLGALTDALADRSYSVLALGVASGLSSTAAQALAVVAGAALLTGALAATRRASAPDADRTLFLAALAAALVFSPIVWTHYFVLLLVPIALASPRLGPLWLLPLAFWLLPHAGTGETWTNQSDGELWRIALALGVTAVAFAGALGFRPGWSPARRAVPYPPAVQS
jgi:alpha-1,2-mannosyltransferase